MPLGGDQHSSQEQAEAPQQVPVVGVSRKKCHVVKNNHDGTQCQQGDHQHRHPDRADLLSRGRHAGSSLALGPGTSRCYPSALHSSLGRLGHRPRIDPELSGTHGQRPPISLAPVNPRILVIDNYDSFVYNLVQYLGELGADPIVHRHDDLSLEQARDLEPDGVLISPGPGRPSDAGLSNALIQEFCGVRPVLGVCLGLQCLGEVFGGQVVRAPQVMHGKTSIIHHTGDGVFAGLPNPIEATRYHSLIVERSSVPEVLSITAETDDGLVMGLRHREHPVEGVQFHPESILTSSGHDMLSNFLAQT